MINLRTLVTLFSLLFAANAVGQFDHPLEGVWEWYRTELGSGEVITPESVGHTIQRVFGEIDAGRLYRHFEDEVLVHSGQYEISHVWVGDVCIEFVGISCSDLQETWNFAFEGMDNLILANDFFNPNHLEYYHRRGTISIDQSTWGSVKTMYR